MADILIRGMEMPTNVADCPLNTFGFCNLAHDSNHTYCIGDSRPEWCPLVPLPEGHGRLGDLDALFEKMYHLSDNEGAHKDSHVDDDLILRDSACYLIEKATTIIEADLEWKMKNCCCFSNTDQAEGWTDNG